MNSTCCIVNPKYPDEPMCLQKEDLEFNNPSHNFVINSKRFYPDTNSGPYVDVFYRKHPEGGGDAIPPVAVSTSTSTII